MLLSDSKEEKQSENTNALGYIAITIVLGIPSLEGSNQNARVLSPVANALAYPASLSLTKEENLSHGQTSDNRTKPGPSFQL
jgi:hypothetical protein